MTRYIITFEKKLFIRANNQDQALDIALKMSNKIGETIDIKKCELNNLSCYNDPDYGKIRRYIIK